MHGSEIQHAKKTKKCTNRWENSLQVEGAMRTKGRRKRMWIEWVGNNIIIHDLIYDVMVLGLASEEIRLQLIPGMTIRFG